MTWTQILAIIAGALAILVLIGLGLDPTIMLGVAVLLLGIVEVSRG